MNFTPISQFEVILDVFSVVAITAIGLAVFLKNQKSWTNRLFFILSMIFNIYVIINSISLHPIVKTADGQLFWIRLVMFLSSFMLLFLFLLAYNFPKKEFTIKKPVLFTFITLSIINAAIAISPFMFTDISYDSGQPSPITGHLFPVYMIYAFGSFTLSIFSLIKTRRKQVGIDKIRTLYFLIGIATTFSLMLILGVVMVFVFNISAGVFMSPIASVVLMTTIGYSIVKHRFLDIKPIIARAVSYSFIVFLLATAYSAALFYGVNEFLNIEFNFASFVISIILATIIALTFQPLHKFVRRFTDRLFFKGVYDSEKILANLTHTVNSTINFDELSEKLLTSIIQEIKVSKSAILLISKDEITTSKAVGYENANTVSNPELNILIPFIKDKDNVFILEDVEDINLKNIFRKYDIEVLVPVKANHNCVAMLILGSKLNGLPYSGQDLNMLDIFASEAGIALDKTRLYTEIKMALDAKTNFIVTVSHQLRTPISGIKWGLDQLKDPKIKDGDQRYILDNTYQKAVFLGNQLDDILIALDLYDKKISINDEPCRVAEIIKIVADEQKPAIVLNNIKLELNIPESLVIIADHNKLKKIFSTLIKNAVAYSNMNGVVNINYTEDERYTTISIKDMGMGVSISERDHMFSQFFRSDRTRAKIPDGLGLGMFIAKIFTEAHKGKIWFESEGEDMGTTFFVSFPKK